MADAVARAGEHRPEFRRHPLQEEVVLGILVVELDHVVVDVLHHQRDLHAVHFELFELHPRHRPGGVLEEDLVDAVADGLAGPELSADQVLPEDLLDDVVWHPNAP